MAFPENLAPSALEAMRICEPLAGNTLTPQEKPPRIEDWVGGGGWVGGVGGE